MKKQEHRSMSNDRGNEWTTLEVLFLEALLNFSANQRRNAYFRRRTRFYPHFNITRPWREKSLVSCKSADIKQ